MTTSDRVAVVTGAAGGIGGASCRALARSGYRVVGLDLVAADFAETSILCDVSDSAMVADALGAAADLGPISALVTAAGVVDEATLLELTDAAWRRVTSISLDGTFFTLRATLPSLIATQGSAVLLSSGWSAQGYPNGAHYAAAKGGVEALMRSAARAFAGVGVRVNAVAPGPVNTPMLWTLPDYEERRADREARIPLGRVGEPEEVAAVVMWLLSSAASYVTGQVVHVSGGLVV